MSGFVLPGDSLATPRAFEAQAWDSILAKNYPDAVRLSWEWLRDEPFAKRSALFGSWIASMGSGDFDTALRLAEASLVANPGDARLTAQALYCEASLGNLAGATRRLKELEGLARRGAEGYSDIEWEVLLNADRGLIAFRAGNSTQGRAQYEKALAIAQSSRLPEWAASVFINFAREEGLAQSSVVPDPAGLQQAIEVFHPSIRGVIESFVSRIRLKSESDKQTD